MNNGLKAILAITGLTALALGGAHLLDVQRVERIGELRTAAARLRRVHGLPVGTRLYSMGPTFEQLAKIDLTSPGAARESLRRMHVDSALGLLTDMLEHSVELLGGARFAVARQSGAPTLYGAV